MEVLFMNDAEIGQALKDIAELKASVRSRMALMRPLLLDRAFIPFSLVSAVFFSGICVLLHILIVRFGSYAAIPFTLKTAVWTSIAVAFIAATIFKQGILKRTLAGQGRTLTFRDFYQDPDFYRFYLTELAGFAGVILIGAKFALVTGSWWYLLPVCGMYMALVIGLFALFFHTREYLIVSALLGVYGALCLFMMNGAQLLWLAGLCLVLFLSMAAVIFFARDNR